MVESHCCTGCCCAFVFRWGWHRPAVLRRHHVTDVLFVNVLRRFSPRSAACLVFGDLRAACCSPPRCRRFAYLLRAGSCLFLVNGCTCYQLWRNYLRSALKQAVYQHLLAPPSAPRALYVHILKEN